MLSFRKNTAVLLLVILGLSFFQPSTSLRLGLFTGDVRRNAAPVILRRYHHNAPVFIRITPRSPPPPPPKNHAIPQAPSLTLAHLTRLFSSLLQRPNSIATAARNIPLVQAPKNHFPQPPRHPALGLAPKYPMLSQLPKIPSIGQVPKYVFLQAPKYPILRQTPKYPAIPQPGHYYPTFGNIPNYGSFPPTKHPSLGQAIKYPTLPQLQKLSLQHLPKYSTFKLSKPLKNPMLASPNRPVSGYQMPKLHNTLAAASVAVPVVQVPTKYSMFQKIYSPRSAVTDSKCKESCVDFKARMAVLQKLIELRKEGTLNNQQYGHFRKLLSV